MITNTVYVKLCSLKLKKKKKNEKVQDVSKIQSRGGGGGGGGTPIYGLYRYVPRDRIWFLRFSVLK